LDLINISAHKKQKKQKAYKITILSKTTIIHKIRSQEYKFQNQHLSLKTAQFMKENGQAPIETASGISSGQTGQNTKANGKTTGPTGTASSPTSTAIPTKGTGKMTEPAGAEYIYTTTGQAIRACGSMTYSMG